MSGRILLPFAFAFICTLLTFAEKQENWVQVQSPHFTVVTNANEKQGRRIADQFERMRSVFHVAFPKLQIDPGAPIIVIAVKDEKSFRELEPEAYLAKGSLKLGGLFVRATEKNYVLLRLGAEGDHPYSVVYHEYTHLLTSKAEWMPLWMNEGLAEFYENTDIHEKDAALGQPSRGSVLILLQNRLLPLPTLFTVDHNSPYYHEENKGSIFYAESWALLHYLEVNDFQQKTQRITQYSTLLSQNVDPVTAASQAFGDLKRLQSDLEAYIRESKFSYFRMATTTEVDDSVFKAQALSSTQADAIRADFLAYDQRYSDAQALLEHVLAADPKNVLAHETKGYLEFRQDHIPEAMNWYKQAVELDSQSYLSHYYFASMAMMNGDPEPDQIEKSLRAAIQLNPSFAPAFDRLAAFLGIRRKNLDEARLMGVSAVSLDPSNIGYRINVANILMEMEQPANAIKVLQQAAKLAKKPEDVQRTEAALRRAQEYEQARARMVEQQKMQDSASSGSTTTNSVDIPKLKRRDFVARGPHQFLVGILKGVHCDNPTLELTVTSKGKVIAMHADNYYKISFSALGFQPRGDLNPCSDLENRPAKVEYVDSADPAVSAQLIAVELHK